MRLKDYPLAPVIDKLAKQSSLPPHEISALRALPYRLASIKAGSYIVRDGDEVENCCALLSGFVYRSKIVVDGARQIIAVHLAGDFVDLQNGLLEVADHNVQALTAAEVAFVPQKALFDLAAEYPKIGQALWRDTVVDAAIFQESIVNIGQRNARQRIAHLICELTVRLEAAGICEGPRYELPMTQEHIGDATGLTAVHVNRIMQRLRTDGLIDTANRTITVLNWPSLQKVGDFSPDYLHLKAMPAFIGRNKRRGDDLRAEQHAK